MLPAANRTVGQNLCAPDVCNTPTGTGVSAPIPYVNLGDHAQAAGFATTVKYEGGNALTIATSIAQTSGDESGTDHPMIKQKGAYSSGNIVRVEQMAAITLTSSATGNNSNAASGASIVPSTATVRFTLASGESGSPLADGERPSLESLRALQRVVEVATDAVALAVSDGVGRLRVSRFTEDLPTRVYAALEGIGELRALLIDLRGNPGGDLDAAIRLASDFLPAGCVIARVVDADGDTFEHRARGPQRYCMPVAIWVNDRTASAAELFAGALQQCARARLLGERTHGKDSAQGLAADQAGALSYRTLVSWALARGRIDGRGLEPDVVLSSTAELDPGLSWPGEEWPTVGRAASVERM